MAIPSSGQVSFSSLQTEFGGSNPISLSEYYAGGSYVANPTNGDGGPIPTSGQLDVSDFRGAYKTLTLTDAYWSNAQVSISVYNGYPTPVDVANMADTDSGTAGYWDWDDTLQDGDGVRFYNVSSSLPGGAIITNIAFTCRYKSELNGSVRVKPLGVSGSSFAFTGHSHNVTYEGTLSGDLTYWGCSNADFLTAFNTTSATTSALGVGLRASNNSYTTINTWVYWLKATVTYHL